MKTYTDGQSSRLIHTAFVSLVNVKSWMIKDFVNLQPDEAEFMLKAPLLVCILIAGADGKIDRKEIREAIAVARQNSASHGVLTQYFQEVSGDFEDKLKILIQNYPYESTQRDPLIVEELSGLNRMWQKLSPAFSNSFYQMLLHLAQKVASSSGGWLGINAIGSQEAKYVHLPMIKDPSKI